MPSRPTTTTSAVLIVAGQWYLRRGQKPLQTLNAGKQKTSFRTTILPPSLLRRRQEHQSLQHSQRSASPWCKHEKSMLSGLFLRQTARDRTCGSGHRDRGGGGISQD